DLDAGELGGSVSFSPPDSERVLGYVLYLATYQPVAGESASRVEIAEMAVGLETMQIPPDTALMNFSHLLVLPLLARI
ncbi:unnamed protein product, partial [Effrenium voratum]